MQNDSIPTPKALELFDPEHMPADLMLVKKTLELVEIHFRQQRVLRFYSAALKTNLYHLNAVLEVHLNQTLYVILQNRIHQEGLKLLKHTSLSIKEISNTLGYCDPGYFVRYFKKREGITPKVFRRIYLENINQL